ncbi:hypothetical protein EVAR_27110_1 [Eumeta japonica]|uniref:Uncharacterized protein n=1 Tax=Eumeta variegata TaxID=151549 RepID=A0A4C1VKX1_EUMVA|nr:hypothetical protein EVAR_27110_1 [Eumeta japonica]
MIPRNYEMANAMTIKAFGYTLYMWWIYVLALLIDSFVKGQGLIKLLTYVTNALKSRPGDCLTAGKNFQRPLLHLANTPSAERPTLVDCVSVIFKLYIAASPSAVTRDGAYAAVVDTHAVVDRSENRAIHGRRT